MARERCNNKQACSLSASNYPFSDPCPGVIKQLRVWYQCASFPVPTVGGNANGSNCYFPFTYKNNLHYQCTFSLNSNQSNAKKWCCTKKDCDAEMRWGECPSIQDHFDSVSENGYVTVDEGRNSYKIVADSSKTWQEAKEHCEKVEKAEMASIRDGFEQSLLLLLANASAVSPWIGLQRVSNVS